MADTGRSRASGQRYRFSALSERQIRILQPDQHRRDYEHSATLENISLDDPGQFAALSYHWGKGNANREIKLDSQWLKITSALQDALQRLPMIWASKLHTTGRHPWPQRLWIDQICIDQGNDIEKVSQIPLMREIYKGAAVVIIWLGKADDYAQQALEYLQFLVRELAQGSDADFMGRNDLPALFSVSGFDACSKLLENAWFHRKWVMQEAGLARDAVIVCGEYVMRYYDFWRGFLAMSQVEGSRSLGARQQQPTLGMNTGSLQTVACIQAIEHGLSQTMGSLSLLRLLELLRNTAASHGQDHVFALLGICSAAEAALIRIEYALSTETVFRNAIAAHVTVHKTLEFLGACKPFSRLAAETGSLTGHPETPPSWVPDWASRHAIRRLGPDGDLVSSKYDGIFDACKDFPMRPLDDPHVLNQCDELPISLIVVDMVVEIMDVALDEKEHVRQLQNPHSDIWKRYAQFCLKVPLSDSLYSNEEDRVNAFVRSIALGGKSGEVLLENATLRTKFYTWFQGTDFLHNLVDTGFRSGHDDAQPGRPLGFIRLLQYYDVVRTLKGGMALTSSSCAIGDTICVVGGCSTPVLLQGVPLADSRSIVKGEVYLDGVMYGEAVQDANEGRLPKLRHVLV